MLTGNAQSNGVQKLEEKDFHLWSTLSNEAISQHGKWVSFALRYAEGADTLVVQNTTTKKRINFVEGNNGAFCEEKWFGCMLPNNRLSITNLSTYKAIEYANVINFRFSSKGQYLIMIKQWADGNEIEIRNASGKVVKTVKGVTNYQWHPNKDSIAYCSRVNNDNEKTNIGLINYHEQIQDSIIANENSRRYENFTWHAKGTSVACVSRANSDKPMTADKLLFYNIGKKEKFEIKPNEAANWPKGFIVASSYATSLDISEDETMVYFTIQKVNIPDSTDTNDVEIWNAADKETFAYRQAFGTAADNPRRAIWLPSTGKIVVIADDQFPELQLTANSKYILVYNPDHNKPTFEQVAPIDYYIKNLENDAVELFLKEQPGTVNNLFHSPNGKHIIYFRDSQWWYYTFTTNEHTLITSKHGDSFGNTMNSQTLKPVAFAAPYWAKDQESIFLFDEFDIWKYNFQTANFTRITKGREYDKVYRIDNTMLLKNHTPISNSNLLKYDDTILLSSNAIDHTSYGYELLSNKYKLTTLAYLPKRLYAITKAEKANKYAYLVEDFDQPAQLLTHTPGSQSKTIYQSNQQYKKYKWGFSKVIKYKNGSGQLLNAVLFYPFNYDPAAKYPMIVSVYEKQSANLHRFTNPTMYNGSGVNSTIITSNGYFLLLPDIEYKYKKTGFDATECVVAATEQAIKVASIDSSKVGLIGHSFGGYETSFIITQTPIFAAALSSAGIHDLISYTLQEDAAFQSNHWRMEQFQMRMQRPFYEDFQGYLENSPITHIAKSNTPLLTYTGKNDKQVDASQTYELYFALRRLRKEHIMLVYPQEAHVLMQPKHQRDITLKMLDWFNYYLKKADKPTWFEPK